MKGDEGPVTMMGRAGFGHILFAPLFCVAPTLVVAGDYVDTFRVVGHYLVGEGSVYVDAVDFLSVLLRIFCRLAGS